MPIQRFEIVLDHSSSKNSYYFPGDDVKGELIVHNSNNVTYEDFYVELIGHCVALVANPESGLVYNNEETYFHSKHQIHVTGGGSHGELVSDEHRFPFTFHLPHSIPQSYIGEIGKVEYVVRAVMKRPLLKHDQHHEVHLVVRSSHSSKGVAAGPQEPIRKSMTKDHMLFRPGGSISASLSTDKRNYVPGETVYVTACIENHTKISIQKSTLQLVMRETCSSAHGYKESEKVLLSLEKGHIDHDDSALWEREPILIPATLSHGHYLPPSGLPHCNVIDIGYEVKLIVHPGPLTADLVESIDIVVGSVPK